VPQAGTLLPHPQRLDGLHRRREGVRRLAQHVRVPAALDDSPVRLRSKHAAITSGSMAAV